MQATTKFRVTYEPNMVKTYPYPKKKSKLQNRCLKIFKIFKIASVKITFINYHVFELSKSFVASLNISKSFVEKEQKIQILAQIIRISKNY